MQIVINLGALLAISIYLSVRFHDRLVQTLPVTLCSIGLALYVLAFFRKLHWITPILAVCLLALCGLFVVRGRRYGFSKAAAAVCAPLKDPQFWINAAALAAIVALVNYRRVLEWDAYNFWGADIKSLFARGGFAEYHSNVAPRFGDYPPFTQLMIWWFLHMFGSCDEGLMFGGYFFYSGLLLFSITGHLRLRRFAHKLAAGCVCVLMLFALPSVVDTSWYRALYVDPILGILWGCLLCRIVLKQTCTPAFLRCHCLLLLLALTLTKSIGFLWALYAVVLYLLWHGVSKPHLRAAGAMAAAVAAGYVPWNLYCHFLQRTTYLTANLSSALTDRLREFWNGTFLSSGNNLAYLKSYGKAFLLEPVHRVSTRAIDLTPALVMTLILALFALFWAVRWLPKRRFVRLFSFAAGVYALTYFILLCSHLTMFYTETQYVKPANMLTQMTRYGAPMNIGFLMLAVALCMERFPDAWRGGKGRLLPCLAALAVFACAGYSVMADCLIVGHDPLNPQRLEQRARYAQTYSDFLSELSRVPLTGPNQRVLLLYCRAEYNPIVSFLASPVSICASYYSEDLTEDALWSMAEQAGASWIYVQDGTGAELARLEEILDGIACGTLYPLSQWSRAGN